MGDMQGHAGPKRVAIYARVSTGEQTPENQLRDLREYVRARGWGEAVEFVDHGVSGTKDRRPALDAMMSEVRGRKIDVVIVAAFDRFSRSVKHLVDSLDTFRHLGVEFVSLREQIDTGSAIGQAIFTIIAAMAELERSLIVERVKSGLRRAKEEGKKIGRPRREILDALKLRECEQNGLSMPQTAKRLGLSEATLRRRLKEEGREWKKGQ